MKRSNAWLALYAASFTHLLEADARATSIDEARSRASMHAERAAGNANAGLRGFKEAVRAGSIIERR